MTDRSVLAAEGSAASDRSDAGERSASAVRCWFGFRMWASRFVCLFVAFWLELDNPYWAGASAAIGVSAISRASLRKYRYRIIGTLVGVDDRHADGLFPQNRIGFSRRTCGVGGVCAFAATLFATSPLPAALAGTRAIIGPTHLAHRWRKQRGVHAGRLIRAAKSGSAILALAHPRQLISAALKKGLRECRGRINRDRGSIRDHFEIAGSDSRDAAAAGPTRAHSTGHRAQLDDRRGDRGILTIRYHSPFCRALSTSCLPRSLPGTVLQRGLLIFR